MRLFLFISGEKATVASRNVGNSAKYVLKIYAFGSAHVKFSVWVTASLSAVIFPSEPIQFWMLIETSTPIDPHEINLYWIWFGLCEIRLLNQAKSNIDVLRKSVRFFIKKNIFFWKMADQLKGFIRGEWNWPISCLNDSETQGVEIPKKFPGKRVPGPPRNLPLWRSFRKSVSIYPRIRSWDL